MRFSDIPGHEPIKARLREMADTFRVPHALMLHGPSGIGKMALARAFAQYIHCENHINGDSCGVCPACLQHQSFNHIDTHYVFPVIKKKSGSPTVSEDFLPEWREFLNQSQWMDFERWLTLLGKENGQPMIYADESAALIRKLHYTAHHARNKVVIMWLPERMNAECANKLLKMIEEPFEDTILLFVSNDASAVLPTIYSRTQRIEMRRYHDELLANYLRDSYSIEQADAMAIAHVAEGNVNAAVRSLGTTKDSSRYLELFITLMRLAYQRKVKELRAWSVDVADLGREKEVRFLDYCQRLIRENFIYNIHVPALNYMTRDESAFSANFARFITERNVEKLIAELNRASTEIAANGNAKIILFDLAIKVILLLKQ